MTYLIFKYTILHMLLFKWFKLNHQRAIFLLFDVVVVVLAHERLLCILLLIKNKNKSITTYSILYGYNYHRLVQNL